MLRTILLDESSIKIAIRESFEKDGLTALEIDLLVGPERSCWAEVRYSDVRPREGVSRVRGATPEAMDVKSYREP